jgi:biotin carboxylase
MTSAASPPTVLVATIGMEYVAPARMPRELKRAGFRVAMLAPEGAWATRTQYLDMLAHMTSSASLATWADVMLQLHNKIQPTYVLPGDDATMRALMTIAAGADDVPSAARDAILPLIVRSLGEPAHYLASVDKAGLVAIARRAGIDVPPGEAVNALEDALAVARDLGYPVILRPSVGTASRGVSMCDDEAALRGAFAALPAPTRWTSRALARALVQRVLTGVIRTRAFVAWQGRELAGCTREGIERWPNALGAGSVTRYVRDAPIADANARLVTALGMSGFGGASYIVDPANGRACLIEINRRIVPATHAARHAGVDLAAAFMCAVRGDAWPGPADTPPGREMTMTLFPQEWLRDRASPHFAKAPTDAPWDDPRLFAAMLGVTR